MSPSSYDGNVPVVIEDRTIFHPPDIHAQRVAGGAGAPKTVTRQSPLMGIIALIAIAGCGYLGWQVNELNKAADEVEISDNKETLAEKDGEINRLRLELAALEGLQEGDFREIREKISVGNELKTEIAALLAQPIRADQAKPRRIRDAIDAQPDLSQIDWKGPAENLIQTEYVDKLTTIRDQVLNWPQPQRAEESTNTGSIQLND